MSNRRARKTEQSAESQSSFRALRLSAPVRSNTGPARLCSQQEFCAIAGVTDQTLRNWRALGLPVGGPAARPEYPLPDAYTWITVFQLLTRPESRYFRKNVRRLSLREALQFSL